MAKARRRMTRGEFSAGLTKLVRAASEFSAIVMDGSPANGAMPLQPAEIMLANLRNEIDEIAARLRRAPDA